MQLVNDPAMMQLVCRKWIWIKKVLKVLWVNNNNSKEPSNVSSQWEVASPAVEKNLGWERASVQLLTKVSTAIVWGYEL